MNFSKKILKDIDFDNIYSIKRALMYLEAEFNKSELEKDKNRARDIIEQTSDFYKNFVVSKNNPFIPFWKNKAFKLHKYLLKRYNGWK